MNRNIECICCDSAEALNSQAKLPVQIFGKAAHIYKCSKCECGSTIPSPSISETYYEKNEGYEDIFRNNVPLFYSFANDLLDVLTDTVQPNGRLLDIACGGGFLVEAAAKRGYDAVGIDTNSDMVEWSQKQGRNVVKGDILDFEAMNGQYDVIVFSPILEHLENPGVVLAHCASLLSDNGVILISQTNYKGFLPRFVPWLWYGWQPKEHYWHFTPKALDSLAGKCQLSPEKLFPYNLHHEFALHSNPKDFVGRNLAAALSSVGKVLSMHDGFNTIYRKVT